MTDGLEGSSRPNPFQANATFEDEVGLVWLLVRCLPFVQASCLLACPLLIESSMTNLLLVQIFNRSLRRVSAHKTYESALCDAFVLLSHAGMHTAPASAHNSWLICA